VIEASVLPFLALWLVSFWALLCRGMTRFASMVTSVVIAIPAVIVYSVLFGIIAQVTGR
jgi:Gpi18-like mannosyltransferase